MNNLPVGKEWKIYTPVLYRFLESEYVDAFFKDGTIRLSSFERFSKHKNEQKHDDREGEAFFIGSTGSQTITAFTRVGGINAYVLSTTMRFDKGLMEAFGCNSYFQINDSTGFGLAISNYIPNVIAGQEGPCLYLDNKVIHKQIGSIGTGDSKDVEVPNKIDESFFTNNILSNVQHTVFLKDKSYSHQSEYRFIWAVDGVAQDYLDIKAPEAIQFCQKPNE